ncbi:MAG: hypothetical protein KJ709_03395 [Nanoarchaeota archaeon]|nr:hypothetical protein [Nanoarchaeota archaeon]
MRKNRAAVLTKEVIPIGGRGPFHPDRDYLRLLVYDIGELEDAADMRRLIDSVLELFGTSQVLDAKLFKDDRGITDIVSDMVHMFNGNGPYNSGYGYAVGNFRTEDEARIEDRYF